MVVRGIFCPHSVLTLYHTILTFNDPEKEDLKTLQEKENVLVTDMFSFSHYVFLPFLKKKILFFSLDH